MPGFSVLTTLAAGVAAWLVYGLPRKALAIVAATSVVLATIGVIFGLDMTTWDSVLAAVFAVAGGALLGRWLPASSKPMAVLLIVASVLDIAWIASGGSGAEGFQDVANISLDLGERTAAIGTLDIALAAAIATHQRARSISIGPAVLAAPVGMIVANVFVLLSDADNLPLVPFIGVGWLLSETWVRRVAIRSTVARSG